jgi:hypothetical protein
MEVQMSRISEIKARVKIRRGMAAAQVRQDYNENHDPKNGQFSSGDGGSGSGGGVKFKVGDGETRGGSMETKSQYTPGHTPGPWKQNLENWDVIGTKGQKIATIHPQSDMELSEIKNIKLIAAAPEMLEQLNRWISFHSGSLGDTTEKEMLSWTKQAIAKAEGRENPA